MPEPHLRLFWPHVVGNQHGGEGVPEVVEADVWEPTSLEQLAESFADVIRTDQLTHRVDAYEIEVLCRVSAFEEPSVLLLLFLMAEEDFLHGGQKRERAFGGIGLHLIREDDRGFPVFLDFADLAVDEEAFIIEVHVIPRKSQDLAPAQTVVCPEHDGNVEAFALCEFEQRFQLIGCVVARRFLFAFRSLHAIEGVAVEDVLLDRPLARAVQEVVIL